jgi:hypothetical protein
MTATIDYEATSVHGAVFGFSPAVASGALDSFVNWIPFTEVHSTSARSPIGARSKTTASRPMLGVDTDSSRAFFVWVTNGTPTLKWPVTTDIRDIQSALRATYSPMRELIASPICWPASSNSPSIQDSTTEVLPEHAVTRRVPSLAGLRFATADDLNQLSTPFHGLGELTNEEVERVEEAIRTGPPKWVRDLR